MKKKILLIDDEVNIAETLADILAIKGYEVKTANDGRHGVSIAVEESPDLILCDVMMPGMDGYAVLEAIRTHQKTLQTPFVFLTAKGNPNDFRHGLDLGADDYLVKPVDVQTLFHTVKNRLEKHDSLLETGHTEENHRINKDLHDTLQQTLLGLQMRLSRFREKVCPENLAELDESLDYVKLAFSQLRMILECGNSRLNPEMGFVAGLERMIERVARYVDFEISLHNELKHEIPKVQAAALFKVLLEVLNNAIKHSHANKLFIQLVEEQSMVTLVVLDDGCGFEQEKIKTGNGFQNIRDRIKEIGGTVQIASAPGDGTSIEITLNCKT